MKKVLATSMLFFLAGGFVSAQEHEADHNCGTYDHQDEIFKMYPELEDHYYAHRLLLNSKMEAQAASNGSTKKTAIYRIPVVFHILHQYGVENITDAQVYDAMRVINEEFNANDPDSVNLLPPYNTMIGNGQVEFVLAAVDPYGNCTNGIEHIHSHETNFGDAFSKINQWNRSRYLNIWVTDIVGAAGAAAYATQPASTDGTGFWLDGVLSNYTYVGSIGQSNAGKEHVLTHEIGHYFSLDHVWGGTNDPEVECGDDGVPDTPITQGHASCPLATHPNSWVDCGDDVFVDTLDWYVFDSINTTLVDITPVPEAINSETNLSGVIFSSFMASGVDTTTNLGGVFKYDNWDAGALNGELVYANMTGAINTSKYYEFTVDPVDFQLMFLTDLRFDIGRDSTGPRSYAVRSSVDGYASNLAATVAPANANLSVPANDEFFIVNDSAKMELGSKVDLVGAAYSTGDPITFRIYAWNAEDAEGDFSVDNVRINGTFGLIEDVQNYMEYSYCNYHFSPDQVTFMHNALNEIAGQRNNLWIDTTLLLTGTLNQTLPQTAASVPLCAPIADFKASSKSVCLNSPMTFTDYSYNAVVDSWEWTFQDGSPATSTSQNPTVSFTSPGLKTVTLTASNAAGSGTVTRTQYIYVSNIWADYNGPAMNNLETGSANWFFENNIEDNYAKFMLVNSGGIDNSRAFKLGIYRDVTFADPFTNEAFYYNRLGGSVDELVSPSYDLRYTTGAEVSFMFAYATNATQTSDITETLKAYVSDDCGATWSLKTIKVNGVASPGEVSGSKLVTGGYAGYSDYTPTSNTEWKEGTFNVTSTSEHMRFKLVFEASDLSSNFYVDNINVTGTLGLVSDEMLLMDLNVYPNPAANGEGINVSYTALDEAVSFTLRDAQGKLISTQVINQTNSMIETTLEGTQHLGAGCYFLEVNSGEHSTTRKVVVM